MSLSVSPCPSLSFHLSSSPLSFSVVLHLLALSMLKMSLSRGRRHIGVSHFSSLSLFLSGLFLFILNYITANFRRVSTVSLALFLLHFSQRSRCISPSSFLPRSLLRPRSRATPRIAAAASQSSYGIPRSLPCSSLGLRAPVCRRPNKYQINETAARNLDVLITGV